ncbi:MAG: 50S ribosomal protein L9 [Deltaproteobacteria bacterium]|nr:50S ribosomal protein L9 [Deltaproteobacteria bacterium]
MKIILKESVDNLGTVGDVVSVKDGYGRNFLIPQGLGILADPRRVHEIEHQKRALEKKRLREMAKAEEVAKALEGVRLTFRRKTSDQEQLFGSVTPLDIETALQAKGFAISRKQIVLDHPIKALGEFPVVVKIQGPVKAQVKVIVEKEGEA